MAELPHILIVDDSRVVRKSLIQHLQGQYEVREECDGEAAWQTLVVDHSIKAVISDLQMPKLNGYELLERVRTSKLRRLQQLPFILVSGEETEEERVRAKELGVSDFVTKGAGSTEVLTRLNNLLVLTSAQETREADRERLVQDPVSGLFTRKYLELQAAQALSHSARHGVDVSVMVLGFDGFAGLCERLGEQVADQIGNRFAKMLTGKMRQEDSLGHFGNGQFAIVSPGTAPAFCATFAERVREAIEVARLSVQGQTVALTVSIGLASVPNDQVDSAASLLDLAGERMQKAMQAGGNRTESGGILPATRPISLHHAVELLAANRPGPVIPHLPALAERILPLLKLMGQELELDLALPLAEIEYRLSERKSEKN
ncbi:GGDEF domain-containing response regulator [Ferribacterium limneticum]|uniref:GGDEF domain-containing response regulator n=1 Tax=Ferribacterium limneticum TaxID=76259 RepID=UPI001CFA220C|nr:diguanylate cyclase [Ferribacterium limneticum]UCV27254.1 diguanylate cyclase [Ferribacterium limneticum]UCV31171.1 diguanylate cyclase [Ferribacterium limneticum]